MAKKVTDHGVEGNRSGQGGNLQAVIDNADLGETIQFPTKGHPTKKGYFVEKQIVLTQSITLIGDSRKSTKITRDGGLGPIFLIAPTQANQVFIIENFELVGNMLSTSLSGGQDCILFSSSVPISPQSKINGVFMHNYSGAGIKMLTPSCQLTVTDCHTSGGTQGIYISASSDYVDFFCENSIIEHASFEGVFAGKSTTNANSGTIGFDNVCIKHCANAVNLSNVVVTGSFLTCYENTLTSSFSGAGTTLVMSS